MMQAIAESGAAMSGASAVHINIFGLQPVVVFGTDEQKRRMLPPLIAGKDKACFAVTEPDAGLDTTALKVRAERRGDHYLLSGQKIWISTAQVANKVLILARTTPLERGQAQDRRAEPVLHRPRSQPCRPSASIDKMGRHAVDSNEMFFDGMTVPAADRIGARRRGLPRHPARDESRAHPDRRRGGRHRPRGVAQGRALRARARGVPAGRSGRTRAIAHPLARMLDGARGRQPDGDEGGKPLRPQAGLRLPKPMPPNISPARRRFTPARPPS